MRSRRPRTPIQEITDPIRKTWASYGKKHAALQKRAERVLQADGRWKTLFRCEHCQQLFRGEDIQANHKVPVGPLASTRPEVVKEYKQRMFCRVAEIEALCVPCHQAHTRHYKAEQRKTEQQCKPPKTNTSPSTPSSERQTAPSSASVS